MDLIKLNNIDIPATKSAQTTIPNTKFYKTERWWLRMHLIAIWALTNAWLKARPAKSSRGPSTWNRPIAIIPPKVSLQSSLSLFCLQSLVCCLTGIILILSSWPCSIGRRVRSQTKVYRHARRCRRTRWLFCPAQLRSRRPSSACNHLDF